MKRAAPEGEEADHPTCTSSVEKEDRKRDKKKQAKSEKLVKPHEARKDKIYQKF